MIEKKINLFERGCNYSSFTHSLTPRLRKTMRFGGARLILRLEIVYSYATASEEATQNDCQYSFSPS